MVAIQGPKVIDRLSEVLPVDVRSLKRYGFEEDEILMTPFTVFRSGYTGEDGVEIILPAKAAPLAAKMLAGKDHDGATVRPAGFSTVSAVAGVMAPDTIRTDALVDAGAGR